MEIHFIQFWMKTINRINYLFYKALTVDNVTAVDKTLEKVLPPSTGFFEKNLENDAIIDQQEDEG